MYKHFKVTIIAVLLIGIMLGNVSESVVGNGVSYDGLRKTQTFPFWPLNSCSFQKQTTQTLGQVPNNVVLQSINHKNGNNSNQVLLSVLSIIVALVVGVVGWRITLNIYKKQCRESNKALNALESQSRNLSRLIRSYKQESVAAENRSFTLNESIKENVSDIKAYMFQKDLIIKLTERKSSICKTFLFINENCLEGFDLNKGKSLSNLAILDAVIKINRDISIVEELLPEKSDNFTKLVAACNNDLKCLSEEIVNPYEWLNESKQHFEALESELNDLINKLKQI